MIHPDSIHAIYRENLRVSPGERVLVYTDKPTAREVLSQREEQTRSRLRDIARLVHQCGTAHARRVDFVEFPAAGHHGAEPPRKLWEAAFGEAAMKALDDAGLFKPIRSKKINPDQLAEAGRIVSRKKKSAADAVIALSHYSTSHTTFRDLLTRVCGTRFASMPLFDAAMFEGPMTAGMSAQGRRTRAVAALLSKAAGVRLLTPDGTDFEFSVAGRKAHADTGALWKPGSFGNLPAGEAFIAPREGTANGVLVLNWAPTRKLRSPVTVRVKGGLAVSIKGREKFVADLSAKLAARHDNANIAEFGVGTNDRATRPDNILESEKILGTVHVALGDNSSFGGTVKTPFHQDFVFFRPTVVLTMKDGTRQTLLDAGELLV